MKILIIEDEPLVAKDLQNHILQLEPASEIIAVISNVKEARQWFMEHTPPDLILSDIQLSDGISFDIFESLHVLCPIIFTTAYDDYAIRAFKLNSIDYLLKPIDIKELELALHKYRSLSNEGILTEQLKNFLGQWSTQGHKKYKERFLTLHRNTLIPIGQDEISFFHKEELIYLHTTTNEKYICEHHTLDELDGLLNPEVFFRVNRQYIIHIQAVGGIKTTHKGLSIQIKPPFNIEIDMSREKATAFKKWVA